MDIKKLSKPNPEFKEKTKILFLSAVREEFGETKNSPSLAFRYFIRGAASGVALMLILGTAATYADQKNVGPENILYPLKRTQEAVKVAFTKEEEKSEFHLELAERRLNEIKEIRNKQPQSPRVVELTQDLKKEVENSFGATKNGGIEALPLIKEAPIARVATTVTPTLPVTGLSAPARTKTSQGEFFMEAVEDEIRKTIHTTSLIKQNRPDPKKVVICESWRSLLENDDLAMKYVLNESPKILERFNRKCQAVIETFPFEEIELEFDE